VSPALNGEAYARPAISAAIVAVITIVGYKPTMAARSLAIDDPAWLACSHAIPVGAINACRDRGCHLVFEPVDTNCATRNGAASFRHLVERP